MRMSLSIREMAGKRLPKRYLTSAHPNLVWRAMLTGRTLSDPFHDRDGEQPIVDPGRYPSIYRALRSLDLLVVLEYFKTPTAMLADYILPSAGGMERPVIQTNAGVANLAYGGPAAISPRFERRLDFDFWRGLGLRLGQASDWPWSTFEEALDDVFRPSGTHLE